MESLNQKKNRNTSIDLIKSFAIGLVVLGHVIAGSVTGLGNTILMDIIWTLQIPLFMIVGGFVVQFSRKVNNAKTFFQYIGRRSLTYLLPWAIWTFLIRGLIFGQQFMFDIKGLLFNMDWGYWFLFSLWVISSIFGVAELFVIKCIKKANKIWQAILICIFSAIMGVMLLGCICYFVSPDFLGAKLTLYYLPFFLIGYFVGEWQKQIKCKIKNIKLMKDMISICAMCVFFALINYNNFYEGGDEVLFTILRVLASLSGSVLVCCIFENFNSVNNKIIDVFTYIGRHSLEIYVSHYLFLLTATIKMQVLPDMNTLSGTVIILINFCIVFLGAILTSYLLNKNKVIKLVLFGKLK